MAVDIGTLRGLLVLDDKFSAKLDIASSKLDATGKKWQAIGGQLNAVGSQLTKTVTLPLLLIGGAAIKAASDFESSFAGVEKTVTATEPQLQKLAQGFRDMAKEIPVNVNEINRIGEAAGQLGIKTENILDFTRVMADLGVATNLSADQAATSLARLANITGLPQTQFDRLGATIVELGNNLATTESEILDFGLRIAGSGKIAGLTEAQILSIGGAMSSVGIEAAAGGTAVQKVLLGMTQAAAEGGAKLDAFAAAAGLSAQQFADAFEKDAAGAFTAFVEGLGVAGDKAFGILADLGLEDERLKRAFLSLAGAGDLLRDAIDTGTTAFEENKALAEEVAKRYETFASQLTIFKNNAQDVFITLGTALLPILQDLLEIATPIIQKLGEAATFFANLPKPVRATALAILAMVAAVGPLLIISGSLISAFGSVAGLLAKGLGFKAVGLAAQGASKGMNVLANTVLPNFLTKSVQGRNALGQFTKATKVFSLSLLGSGGITGALGTVVTFLTGPVGIAVAIGVALLAWKPFRDVIVAIGGFLFTLARGALKLVIGGLKMLASVLSPVIDFVGAVARAIIGPLGDALVAAAGWISDLNEGLNELITNEAALAFEDATAKAQGLADTTQVLTDVFRKFGQEGLETWLKNADRTVVSIDDLKAGLGVLESQGKLTEEEFDALRTALLEAGTQATATGDALVDDLATGATAATAAHKKLVEMLGSLGVVTKVDALAGIQGLTTALESGLVPPKQMVAIIDELATQYEDLGLRGIPEVEAALQRLNSRYETTNGILDTQLSKQRRIAQILGNQPPFMDDVGLSLKDMASNWDDVGLSVSKAGPPFRAASDVLNDLGIKIPDVDKKLTELTTAVASGRGPVRQLVEAIRRQRDEYERLGVLTPDLNKKLNELERTALMNATAADRAALGFRGLFDGFRTGIPEVDKLLGKFSGFLGIFKSIGGALGGLGSKFGSFFSKIGGLFGIGGKDAGGGFLSGLSSSLGGGGGGGFLSKIFGGGGGAGSSFFDNTDSFLVAGQQGASGFLGGLSGILGSVASFAPIIGPLLAAFGGPLLKGLKALGGKIAGVFKGLFGGPSGAELAGRKVASAFTESIRSEISAETLAAVKLQFPDQIENASFLASLQDKLIATGVAAEAAGAQARQWGLKLAAATKIGGDAVQGVIDQINAATQATIDVIEKSVDATAKAQDAVVENASTTAAATQAIVEASASDQVGIANKLRDDKIAAQQAVLKNAQLSNSTMIADATMTSDRISRTLRTGLRMVEDQLMAVSKTGAAAFRSISDAADIATRNAVQEFEQMRNELVGQSIITDTVDKANRQILTIGDAAKEAARNAALAFESQSISAGGPVTGFFDKKAQEESQKAFEKWLEDQGKNVGDLFSRNVVIPPSFRRNIGRAQPRFAGFGRESRSQPRFTDGGRDSGGGTGRNVDVIQLVVDGVVLTEIVLRNQSRVLANKGLGRG